MPEQKQPFSGPFWTTLAAMIAVITPASVVSWLLLTSVFVQKDEYNKQHTEQAVTNQKVETSLVEIDKRMKSVDTSLQTLNNTLQKINVSTTGRR